MDVTRITVDSVRARLDRGEPVVFVDARSTDSWNKAKTQITGSIRVPPDDVAWHFDAVPQGPAIVAYCT
jgi:rhodanese-related sulfurtransferase